MSDKKKDIRFSTLFFVLVLKTVKKYTFTFFYQTNSYLPTFVLQLRILGHFLLFFALGLSATLTPKALELLFPQLPNISATVQEPLNTRTVVKNDFLKIEFPFRIYHYIT
jgi:hypothetical protein